MIFFVEKMREAFALQKLLTFFQQKNIGKFKILKFEILTSCKLTTLLVLNNRAQITLLGYNANSQTQSDAAEHGILTFAYRNFYGKNNKNKNVNQESLKVEMDSSK